MVRAARHLGLDGAVVAVLGGHAGAWYRTRARGAVDRPVRGRRPRARRAPASRSSTRPTGDADRALRGRGAARRRRLARVEAAVRAAIAADPAGTVVVLAGSLPPGAPVDGYARLAAIAAAAGARAVVDSEGASLAAALAARPVAGEGQRAPRRSPSPGRARGPSRAPRPRRPRCAHRGAGTAIVTRGVHGAVLATADGAWALGSLPAATPRALVGRQRRRVPRRVHAGRAGAERLPARPTALRLAAGAAGAANATAGRARASSTPAGRR